MDEWRLEQSILRTKERRPDLYEKWLSENPPVEKKKKRRKKSSEAQVIDETVKDSENNGDNI